MTDIYLDCEWFPNQQIFLIGYGYSVNNCGQLYDGGITLGNLNKILKPVTGYIYFYGPDVGMLEKYFNIDIRHRYKCINLMPIFRHALPGLESYRLCELEKLFKLHRSGAQYKKDIRTLIRDWHHPIRKKSALKYNLEDVQNLIKLKRMIFSEVNITVPIINEYIMP